MNILSLTLYAGTFVFALAGALKARSHQMDIFGAAVLAFATAYGGGTLRDLLIGIRPGWMNDNVPLALVVAAVIVVFLWKQTIAGFENAIFLTDAIGLGLFTAGGIEKSLSYGISESYAVVLGIMSATFGGLIADLLSGRIPALLQRGELYATACLAGGILYIILHHLTPSSPIILFSSVAVVVLVRIISRKLKWQLPRI